MNEDDAIPALSRGTFPTRNMYPFSEIRVLETGRSKIFARRRRLRDVVAYVMSSLTLPDVIISCGDIRINSLVATVPLDRRTVKLARRDASDRRQIKLE